MAQSRHPNHQQPLLDPYTDPRSPLNGLLPPIQTGQLPFTQSVTDSSSSDSEISTTAGSVLGFLQFRQTPDPFVRPIRKSTSGYMDMAPKETARYLVLLQAHKPNTARRIRIKDQLEEVAGHTDRWREVGGWLDNERRRESKEADAIRNHSMKFETIFEFRDRIGITGADGVFANNLDDDEEDEEDEAPNPGPPEAPADDDDDEEFPNMETENHRLPDAHQKRRDKQLEKGLELFTDGARNALWPADKSTPHALPKDYRVPEVENNDFRLRAHQRDGVGRMLHLEQKRKSWVNADDPGLGKTVQAISLVVIDKENRPDGVTLCVVPKPLLGYWKSEFKNRTSLKVLVFHGETAKTATRADILKHDVVITTYETLTSQWKLFANAKEDWPLVRAGDRQKEVKIKKTRRSAAAAGNGEQPKTKMQGLKHQRADSPLFSVKFRRVILDEGHRIKNEDTQVSKAVADVNAEFRGCITGTPMQNDYGDFYSVARFLHLAPWDNRDLFQACFIQKSKDENTSAAAQLDKMMEVALGCLRSCVTIRRLKNQMFDGEPIAGVEEPARSDLVVNLGPANQEIQMKRRDMWDTAHRAVLRENTLNHQEPGLPTHPDIFIDLTEGQLQAIDPILTTASYGDLGVSHADSVAQDRDIDDEENVARTSIPERGELLERFQQAPKSEQMKTGATRRQEFIQLRKSESSDRESECVKRAVGRIVRILGEEEYRLQSFQGVQRKEEAARGKIIVFSNFLNALDLIAVALDRRQIPYYELNGHCSDTQRDDVIRQFEEVDPGSGNPKDFTKEHIRPDKIRVLLASVKVAAEGLNLVHASHIILLGPGWNPFVRIQAISRAHRIGQTRQVDVYDIWAANSMHVRVRRVQAVKLRKVTGVMEDSRIRDSAGAIMKWTLETFKGYMAQKNVLDEFAGESGDEGEGDE